MKTDALEKSDIFKDGLDVNNIVLARDDTTVSLTQGKIILWFGRQAAESLIREIIFGISSADSSVTLEQEIICEFKNIAGYENKGYILTSYGKTKGGYRVIFNIPFSKRTALVYLIESIVEELRKKDVKRTLHWDGSREKIVFVCNKLKKIEGWELKSMESKD